MTSTQEDSSLFKIKSNKVDWSKIIKQVKADVVLEYARSAQWKLHDVLNDWKALAKAKLSVPYNRNQGSTGWYPRMRTGSLRRSLSYRTHSMRYNEAKSQATLRFSIIWDDDPKSIGFDYGEHLNSSTRYSHRKFFGWKLRLYKKLKQSLRGFI